MIESQIPLWAGIPASILLVLGGLLALTGSAGLLRFVPSMPASTRPRSAIRWAAAACWRLPCWCFGAVVAAGVHEVIITLLLIVSSPVTAMLLMRARDLSRQPEAEDADRTPDRGEEQGNKGRNMYSP